MTRMDDKPASAAFSKGDQGSRLLSAAVLFALAVLPILLTPFPPSTDLPQHIAQVRLFKEALANPAGPYVIQWAAPNTLIYWLLLGLWALLPVEFIARAALILIVLAWVTSIHWLAMKKGRSQAAAVAASLLVFNQSFYWGFLNFLVGFPVFVIWFKLVSDDARRITWKRWTALAVMSFLLYGSHALWVAAGGVVLVLFGVLQKIRPRVLLLRISTMVPVGIVAMIWYPNMSAARSGAGFDVAAHWAPFFDRLGSFLDAAFGGVRGPVETVAFVFVLLWAGLSIYQNAARLRTQVDRDLLAVALFFAAVVLVFPDKFANTIFFSSRWFPAAMVFLLLALPAPRLRGVSVKAVALAVAAVFFLNATFFWRKYDRVELSGFRESLDSIPASSRVLGLDLVKESEFIKGRPFLQIFAYAQVYHGGELSFSFAEHYSGLVAYRIKRESKWTPGLDWHASKVKRSDFTSFDFVLVGGDATDFGILGKFGELAPVTATGNWRLYRIIKASVRN